MMASHSLAISKASLAAGFMRPDPTSVPRDQVNHLHDLLNAVLVQCSPANIQRCKAWLVQHALPSSARVTAIGKYLVALSSSLNSTDGERGLKEKSPGEARARRKQLHVLYLLNDLLHSSKYHSQDSSAYSTLTGNIQPHLVELFSIPARYDPKIYKKQHDRIKDLLDIWDTSQYFHASLLLKLREAVEIAGHGGGSSAEQGERSNELAGDGKPSREAPFIMPASHGDPSAPYYELPAGNMIPHVIPNSTIPINTHSMRALQFTAGPADEKLASAVKAFLKEADAIYGTQMDEDEGISMEIDEIGQTVFRDAVSGDVFGGESYYGWSKNFCEQMKKRATGQATRSRSSSQASSRDRSYSPRKRQRYSSSAESRSRSRGHSRSRSPPRFRPHSGNNNNDGGRFRSRSRSRSRSPYPARSPGPSFRNSERPGFSGSPPLPGPQPPPPFQHPGMQGHQVQSSPPLPFPNPFPHGIPLGPDGMPIPPPPPPNYTGPWPPPPPPPPPVGSGGVVPFPPFAGFMPPPMPNAGGGGGGGGGPQDFQRMQQGRWMGQQVYQQQQQQQQGGHQQQFGGYGRGGGGGGRGRGSSPNGDYQGGHYHGDRGRGRGR